MVNMSDKTDFQNRMQKIEELIQKIETSADPQIQSSARELLQLLMELHGTGISRMMEIVFERGEQGSAIINSFARDNLVSSLMMLYDLHPVDIETRVIDALDKVRPHLRSQGANVELLGVRDRVVLLQLQETGSSCNSSAMTLKKTIEEAIYEAAPDIDGLEIQGMVAPQSNLVQLKRSVKQNASTPAPIERCELCSVGLAPDHKHLIDPASRKLICACDPCAILFSNQEGKYLRASTRINFLNNFRMTDAQWDSLMIPIGMAFFYQSTQAGKIIAFYPSPAGPTESLLTLESWQEIVEENPILRAMESDVEALLVNRLDSNGEKSCSEYYLVPIDECYKLVGLIRSKWHGLSGGTEVWKEIKQFFAGLKERSAPIGETSRA
jgi:Fe-S cluster biogenesis protein NfuA